MAWWAVFLGVALLTVTFVDVLWTTLWVDSSAGPLTSKLTTGIWRGWRRLVGSERHRVLSLAGPMTLTLITLMWVSMIWLGWTLIFAADEGALTSSTHARPFTWVDRLYFAGYSVFTLGNGDFAPARGGWQLLTVLAVASGLIAATLAITYLLSVIAANVQKRTFAKLVAGLGATPEEIVRLAWDGSGLADRPLAPPRLGSLREAGIPTVTDEAFGEALEALADRRKQLLGLLESDARRWPPDAR